MEIENEIKEQIPDDLIDFIPNNQEKFRQKTKILDKLPPPNYDVFDEKLNAQLECYLGLIKKGNNVNSLLKTKNEFNNIDALYQQMNNFDIDEYSSNYPIEIFNPRGFEPNEYYDALARKQTESHVFAKGAMHSTISDKSKKSGWDAMADPTTDMTRINPYLSLNHMSSLTLLAAQNKAFVEKK